MRNQSETSQDTAVIVENPMGQGGVLILCEHASNHIPEHLSGLGLSEADRVSHAAWDPGALPVARMLSTALDAPLVASGISRLVYDCNRPPEAPSAMPEKSELIEVPGNRALDQAERDARTKAYYEPFIEAVARMTEAAQPKAIVTMHTFTPVYYGAPRKTEIGILHDADTRLADAMLAVKTDHLVERNEPYGPTDGVTHSLRIHGVEKGIANVMIEVRNDLLETEAQQTAMAETLLAMLRPALEQLEAHDA